MREGIKFPPLRLSLGTGTADVEIITSEGLLSVLMTQDHLVLLHVLDLSVLGNAFFVIAVILFDGLNEEYGTCGRKGEMSLRCSSFYQSIFLKNGWYLT